MRVLLTGAASGIGAATAAQLKADGAAVVAVDIAEPAGCDGWLRADLGDPAAIDALPLEGRFDALVNAAGLPPRPGRAAEVLAVNALGLVRLTERVLPLMPPGGSVVSVASKAGARWRENLAQARRLLALEVADLPGFVAAEGIDPVRAYDLSKEAVIVWTRAQAPRLKAAGLRANTVSPAAVDTPILGEFVSAFGERAARGEALMGRPGTAAEVAAVVAFLARPESGWVQGVDLPVDGGLHVLGELERGNA